MNRRNERNWAQALRLTLITYQDFNLALVAVTVHFIYEFTELDFF